MRGGNQSVVLPRRRPFRTPKHYHLGEDVDLAMSTACHPAPSAPLTWMPNPPGSVMTWVQRIQVLVPEWAWKDVRQAEVRIADF